VFFPVPSVGGGLRIHDPDSSRKKIPLFQRCAGTPGQPGAVGINHAGSTSEFIVKSSKRIPFVVQRQPLLVMSRWDPELSSQAPVIFSINGVGI
jgi:hypothetical protein